MDLKPLEAHSKLVLPHKLGGAWVAQLLTCRPSSFLTQSALDAMFPSHPLTPLKQRRHKNTYTVLRVTPSCSRFLWDRGGPVLGKHPVVQGLNHRLQWTLVLPPDSCAPTSPWKLPDLKMLLILQGGLRKEQWSRTNSTSLGVHVFSMSVLFA